MRAPYTALHTLLTPYHQHTGACTAAEVPYLKCMVGCSLHCTVGKCGKSSVNQLPYGIACYVPKVNFAWLRCTHHIPAFSTVVYK